SGGGNLVQAFSLTSGAVLWGPVPVGGIYAAGSIVYERGRVFALTYRGELTALDAATGAVLWQSQLEGQYAFTSPPTPTDGSLYVAGTGSGSTLYAVDETSGLTRWASHVGAAGDHTAPAVD